MATSSTDHQDSDDGDGNEDTKGPPDIDFLSSIEICYISRSDVLLLQNWDHVNHTLDHLLNIPRPTKTNTNIDFSRVRNYILMGQSTFWRQIILSSEFVDPNLTSSFRRHAKNINGKIEFHRFTSSSSTNTTQDGAAGEATIGRVLCPNTQQIFRRIRTESIRTQNQDRIRYFFSEVLPRMINLNHHRRTMIYIASYFDFVSIRNRMLRDEQDVGNMKKGGSSTTASFVSVTEYARVSEVSRGRARFMQGRKDMLLYTGRAHFFMRHLIKGARRLVFVGLPEYGGLYPDLVNMLLWQKKNNNKKGDDEEEEDEEDGLGGSTKRSCLVLYTKYDAHALARIVGSENCERMVKGDKRTFLFTS